MIKIAYEFYHPNHSSHLNSMIDVWILKLAYGTYLNHRIANIELLLIHWASSSGV